MTGKWGDTRGTLMASLLSVIATLLAVIVTEATGLSEAEYILPLAYGALGVALAFLAGTYVRAYIREITAARDALHVARLVNGTIPKLVAFSRREDTLVLLDNGDADLEWRFDLKSPRDETITELTCPIYSEVNPDELDWDFVEIVSLEVDGARVAGIIEPREFRRSAVRGRPSLLCSALRVPVALGEGRSASRLVIRLRLRGVFPRAAELEAFYVDIPYLTESLKVTVMANEGSVHRPLREGEQAVEAMSGLMEVADTAESANQSAQCQNVGRTLVWETLTPKLGYRYLLNFQADRAPSRTAAGQQ
jgi:hypothetical protein